MRYKLKDYQTTAVEEILATLEDAREDLRRKGRKIAFALSATTGAGKTVIAATVIEALFTGSAEFDFELDASAVVLWVTDDPSLNDQTRSRILESADRLEVSTLVTIDEKFVQEKFEPGRLYFLNVQKLAANTSYVKRSDDRDYTLWDTIANTIQDDTLTLYVVLDEAHRGMRAQTRNGNGEPRSTIVQRLVNGHDGIPAVPLVWGISATIERFDSAMKEARASGRTTYPPVTIDPSIVQESGLLKDTIVLDFPDEKGNFETTLLRTAVGELIDASKRWDTYAVAQQLAEGVAPLLVLQVGNKPGDGDLLRLLDAIASQWPDLPSDALANVFGEHKDLRIGKYHVPYVPPQDVQDAFHIRVLFAKDAISTGWDCPRAEVLYSLRPAQDRTHITQLLGRMVRTPLARRIPSDERLNAVTCFLPHFNVKTAIDVANRLTGKTPSDDAESAVPQRKVLIAPVELTWNKVVPEAVRDFLSTLPSEPKPKKTAKPIKRVLDLAAALSWDKLLAGGNKAALESLYAVLDGQAAQHAAEVEKNVEDIHTAEIRRVTAQMADQSTTEQTLEATADEGAIADAFRAAARALRAAVANGYVKYLVDAGGDSEGDAISEAQARVGGLMQVPGVHDAVEAAATQLTKDWLANFYVDIKHLSDERQAVYADIRSQAREPEHQDTVIPERVMEESKDADGNALPTRPLHVLADDSGRYPVGSFNDPEIKVVDRELSRQLVIGWYRNPSQATAHAIRVPYRVGDTWRSMQPDFVFVSQRGNGTLAASIVDPHSSHLSDALPKLIGLADFAERHGDAYLRIDALDENKAGDLVVLNMKDADVRAAVRSAATTKDLYDGPHAITYK